MFGLDRILDRAKGVAIAAGAATLLAIAGIVVLAISAAQALQVQLPGAIQLPVAAAYATVAVFLLIMAMIAMWVGVHPKTPEKTDLPQPKVDPTQAVLEMIDVPIGVATHVIKTRPVATTLAIAGVGLLVAWKPKVAIGLFDGLLSRVGR